MSKATKAISSVIWVIIGILFISPLAVIIINSLKTFHEVMLDPTGLPETPQWINYPDVWKITNFPVVFFNTLVIIVASLFGVVVTTSLVGYALARNNTKSAAFVFLLVMLSMMLPFQTLMIPLVRVTQMFGMRDNMYALIPIYIGMSGALAVLLYRSFSKSIPIAIEESARIDGCCGMHMFWRIVFPLLKPVTSTVSVLYALQFWNDITLPLVLLTHKENTTVALSQLIFFRELVSSRWNQLLASGVLASIPITLFFILMQKRIIAGVMQGAVKG